MEDGRGGTKRLVIRKSKRESEGGKRKVGER